MRWSAAATASACLLLAGCGGERQDANEPSGTYPVEVTSAAFPATQHLAQQETFAVTVRNMGGSTIPNLAVTVQGFSVRKANGVGDGAQSDPSRPVWVVDAEPAGGVTSFDDTWTAGRLAPRQAKTLRWKVTPVVSGVHRLQYRVAAGLDGKAKAAGNVAGTRVVTIGDRPQRTRVDPDTGAVQRLPGAE